MPQTLASSTDLLCPVAEFLRRVDKKAVGWLASDTTTPVPEGDLPSNANIKAALQDASGIFEAAAHRGQRYSKDDLAVILAASTSMAAGMMFRIVADIAWSLLFERRPNRDLQPPASLERSLLMLEELSDGKKIFPFIESAKASVMERVESSADDIEQRNGAVYQARAFYGRRSDRA